jgi:low temperature requirement protein LtrA
LFLLGNLWFKGTTTGRLPLSHMAGLVALLLLLVVAPAVEVYQLCMLATLVLVAVAVWEYASLTKVAHPVRPSSHH